MFVAPDAAQNDIVLFSSLEGIHTSHFNIFVQVLLERSVELHIIDDIGTLTLVGCYDADLGRYDARLEEFGNDLLNVRCFRPESSDKQLQLKVEDMTSTC